MTPSSPHLVLSSSGGASMSILDKVRKLKRSSSEVERIVALPRRPDLDLLAWAETLRTPGGEWSLRRAQAQVLYDLATLGGAVGSVTVGGGKTLISALAGTVTGVHGDKVAVLVPSPLAREFDSEFETYQRHFKVTRPTLLRYSILSRPEGVKMLEAHDPDVLVLDEGHRVRNPHSARTKRLLRFLRDRMKAGRPVRLVVLSGTLFKKGVSETAELFRYSLRGGSPVPLTYSTLMQWGQVLDAGDADVNDLMGLKPLCDWAGCNVSVSGAREAFKTRLRDCQGVTMTERASCDASIYLLKAKVKLGGEALEAYRRFEKYWELPDGSFEMSATLAMAQLRRLAWGYYYVWDWPDGRDDDWLEARSAYHAAVGALLRLGRSGLDSPGMVEAAAAAGDLPKGRLQAQYWATRQVYESLGGDAVRPPTKVMWVDPTPLYEAIEESFLGKSILWYRDRAQLAACLKCARLAPHRIRVARPGQSITSEDKAWDGMLCLSVQSHGEGFNLQPFSTMTVLTGSPTSGEWEQMIGRVHRPGQDADEITVRVYTQKVLSLALAKAREDAYRIQATTGAAQKLCLASEM